MPSYSISQVGTGTSSPLVLDFNADPFSVALWLSFTTAGTGTVQMTGENPWNPAPWGTATVWQNHPTLAALTTSANGNIAFPACGVRVVNTGTGTVTLQVVQAGYAKGG